MKRLRLGALGDYPYSEIVGDTDVITKANCDFPASRISYILDSPPHIQ